MLKMFSTQLTGLFQRIRDKEEFSFEDGARLLAQAVVGDGNIYIYSSNELTAVEAEALYSTEPLEKAKRWEGVQSISDADRVLVITRYAHDDDALKIGALLKENDIPFVSISTTFSEEHENISMLSDVHFDLQLKKGLLPDEEGNRFGYPVSMAALFVYYGLKFTLDEILSEY